MEKGNHQHQVEDGGDESVQKVAQDQGPANTGQGRVHKSEKTRHEKTTFEKVSVHSVLGKPHTRLSYLLKANQP